MRETTRGIAIVEATAASILARDPGPVVRLRLLRDLLSAPPNSPEMIGVSADLPRSEPVRELLREQRTDGSWGRFHSRDSSAGKKIPSTEIGVQRALALGLTADSPSLRRTADYLAAILDGRLEFPDPPEKNSRWPIGVKLFSGAILALIQPDSETLDGIWNYWLSVASRAFAGGRHNPDAELRAHRDLTGLHLKELRYLGLNGKYQLAILGSRPGKLPRKLERSFVSWVWHSESGIRYLNQRLTSAPSRLPGSRLEAWFESLELLSRFPSFPELASRAVDWLWSNRTKDGLWDFGARSRSSYYFPLSDSWRRKIDRTLDWSTRVLALLATCLSPPP